MCCLKREKPAAGGLAAPFPPLQVLSERHREATVSEKGRIHGGATDSVLPRAICPGRAEEGYRVEGITRQVASLGSCCVQGSPACGFLVPWDGSQVFPCMHFTLMCVLRMDGQELPWNTGVTRK